jgi:hypothetical protein
MKKLHLNVDSLQVESFTTDGTATMRGTVRGESIFEPSGYTYCIPCGGGGYDTDDCTRTCIEETLCCHDITPNTTCDM